MAVESIGFLKNCEVICDKQDSATKTTIALKGSVKNKN